MTWGIVRLTAAAGGSGAGRLEPDQLWAAWQPDPLVVAGLVALALGYARGLRALRRTRGGGRGGGNGMGRPSGRAGAPAGDRAGARTAGPDRPEHPGNPGGAAVPGSVAAHGGGHRGAGRVVTRGQVWAFGGALAACAAALASPLDALSGALFSAHMVQHMLLILVAAPLLVVAAPGLPLLLAVPRRLRGRLARWRQHPAVRAAWRALTVPLVAWSLHVAALWGWHLPAAYQAALGSPLLHALEHVSFLATAWLLWLVALGRVAGRPAAGRPFVRRGWVVLLVFVTAMQGNALGAVLTLAPAPLYPEQVLGAPAWGLTALGDQQLAGLVMWVPGDVVYLAAAVVLFRRWFAAMERAAPSAPDITPTDVTSSEVRPTDVTPSSITPTDLTPTEVRPTHITPDGIPDVTREPGPGRRPATPDLITDAPAGASHRGGRS